MYLDGRSGDSLSDLERSRLIGLGENVVSVGGLCMLGLLFRYWINSWCLFIFSNIVLCSSSSSVSKLLSFLFSLESSGSLSFFYLNCVSFIFVFTAFVNDPALNLRAATLWDLGDANFMDCLSYEVL